MLTRGGAYKTMSLMVGVDVSEVEAKDPEHEAPTPMDDEDAAPAGADAATADGSAEKSLVSKAIKGRKLYRQLTGGMRHALNSVLEGLRFIHDRGCILPCDFLWEKREQSGPSFLWKLHSPWNPRQQCRGGGRDSDLHRRRLRRPRVWHIPEVGHGCCGERGVVCLLRGQDGDNDSVAYQP